MLPTCMALQPCMASFGDSRGRMLRVGLSSSMMIWTPYGFSRNCSCGTAATRTLPTTLTRPWKSPESFSRGQSGMRRHRHACHGRLHVGQIKAPSACRNASCRIIAVTGHPPDRDRMEKAGINMHLLKPVGASVLAQAVCDLASWWRELQARRADPLRLCLTTDSLLEVVNHTPFLRDATNNAIHAVVAALWKRSRL